MLVLSCPLSVDEDFCKAISKFSVWDQSIIRNVQERRGSSGTPNQTEHTYDPKKNQGHQVLPVLRPGTQMTPVSL